MDVIVTFSRPEITTAVTRGAARLLVDLGYAPLAEVTLPNGRRADLMALSRKGHILIIEVKSGLEDFRVDRKWHEYMPYCDAFAFAVARARCWRPEFATTSSRPQRSGEPGPRGGARGPWVPDRLSASGMTK